MNERNIKEKCEIPLCLIHKIQKESLTPTCKAGFTVKDVKRKKMFVWPEADASFPLILFLISSGGFCTILHKVEQHIRELGVQEITAKSSV